MANNAIVKGYKIADVQEALDSNDEVRNVGLLKDLYGDLHHVSPDMSVTLTGDDTMLVIRSVKPSRRMFIIISTEFKDITINTIFNDTPDQVHRKTKELTGKSLHRLLAQLVDMHSN